MIATTRVSRLTAAMRRRRKRGAPGWDDISLHSRGRQEAGVKSRDQLTPRAVSRVTGRPQGNG